MAKPGVRPWASRVRRDWNTAAPAWERREPQLLASLAAVDPWLIRALEPRPGHRLLDFGCGTGEPALTLAPLVLPGRVVGVDLSPAMIAVARRRAALRGLSNVRFVAGDVAGVALRGRFDGIVARFGIMFVEDVPATLARLHRRLRPGGRIALAVWGPASRNAHFAARAAVVREFAPGLAPDPETTPGPLRFARPGLLARRLRAAGFREVRTRGVAAPLLFLDLEDYLESQLAGTGPLPDIHARLGPRGRQRLRERLLRPARRFLRGGVLRLPGFAWIVHGRRSLHEA